MKISKEIDDTFEDFRGKSKKMLQRFYTMIEDPD